MPFLQPTNILTNIEILPTVLDKFNTRVYGKLYRFIWYSYKLSKNIGKYEKIAV